MHKFRFIVAFVSVALLMIVLHSYALSKPVEESVTVQKQAAEQSGAMRHPDRIMGLSSSTFWSSADAALGGFLGVIVFFIVRIALEFFRSKRKKFIKAYFCANRLNEGQASESEGDLMHHHGRKLSASNDLQEFKIDHPVWEWTRDQVGRGQGDSVIFGPYTTDFEEPGLYSVVFRMRGVGLSRPTEIINDRILFELDVSSTLRQYTPVGNRIEMVPALRTISRKYIRINDLAVGDWIDFEMRFHSDNQGLWEYRVLAYDGAGGRLDNIAELGTGVRFLFDKISIFKQHTFKLPWV